ncbi:MAG: MBL fold metallo-hydrolase [Thermoplasmata archaeon]
MRWTPPNRTFERRHRLPGRRRAELLSFGSGHTASDAILHLPTERTVFAGDLVVVGSHPNLTSGDPEHWRTVLARIERLGVERIVHGHGPVGSAESAQEIDDYLGSILALAERSGMPEIPRRFRRWAEHGQFEENVRFVRNRRRP